MVDLTAVSGERNVVCDINDSGVVASYYSGSDAIGYAYSADVFLCVGRLRADSVGVSQRFWAVADVFVTLLDEIYRIGRGIPASDLSNTYPAAIFNLPETRFNASVTSLGIS